MIPIIAATWIARGCGSSSSYSKLVVSSSSDDGSSRHCPEVVASVGPMRGGDYAFKRKEVKRRKELKSLYKKNSVPKIQLVNAYVAQVTPTPSQSKRAIPKRAVNLSPGGYIPPMPLNGKVYGMGEFLSIIGEYRKGSNARGAMIRSIQSHGYLEVQKTAIYRCIDQHEKGRCFNLLAPWPERGGQAYVNDEEAEVIAERIRNNVGEKNTHDIVAEFVLEIVKNKGIVRDTINPRTIKNYMAYISTFPGVSLADISIPKTNNRGRAVRARQSSHDANTTALTSEKGGNSKPKAEATSPAAKSNNKQSKKTSAIAAGAEAKAEVLKISNRDIENEAARIMAKRRDASPELSGTLQASSTTVDEIDDTPWGNVIQASNGLNLLARAASESHPLPPVAASNPESQADPPTPNATTTTTSAGGGALSWITINGEKVDCCHFEYPPTQKNDQECMLKIDGEIVYAEFHELTIKGRKDHCRPRPILSASIANMVGAQVIDNSFGDLVHIRFPSGRQNTVLFARNDSKCKYLRELHEFITNNRNGFEELYQNVPPHLWEKDSLAGGKYLPMGMSLRSGIQGSNPRCPFLRQESAYNVSKAIAHFYENIYGRLAMLMKKYCGAKYSENHKLYEDGHDCIFPSPKAQMNSNLDTNGIFIGLSQIVLRVMDNENTSNKQNPNRTALHVDSGDVDSDQFLTFIPMGGQSNCGGFVSGTDLMVFEHEEGGASYRLRTTIPDTVVILLMNSARQLHGNVEDDYNNISAELDRSLWSARLIGYGRLSVQHFIDRRRRGAVRGNAFWDTQVMEHLPLQRDQVRVGNLVSAKFGSKLFRAEICGEHDNLYLLWDGEKRRTKLRPKQPVYSTYCSKSNPNECEHCNPTVSFLPIEYS